MKLNAIFQNGCILQANKPIYIFGTGAGEATVTLNGATAEATAEGDKWVVELPAMDYGGPYELSVTLNGEAVTLSDVWLGDVYLLAGQSNMQLTLASTDYPKELYRPLPNVRLFSTPRPESNEHFKPEDGWVTSTRENAQYWSALGYMVASFLTVRSSHKIGLVECYQGAAAIQTYLPPRAFEQYPEFDLPFNARYEKNPKYFWNYENSYLYKFHFESIIPYGFAAVLWYQGESNANKDESVIYDRYLTTLITMWREDLRDADLPFVVVQIADYVYRADENWARIQEMQTKVGKEVPHVITVPCRDVCENTQIHPAKKSLLARRMADAVLELCQG